MANPIINIGHGNPTFFRPWWNEVKIFPNIDTRANFYYEYQEDDPIELIRATHKFHSIFGTDCSSSWLAYGNGSTQVIHATLYTISKRLNRPIIVAYAPPVYMLMHEFLSNCNFATVTFDLTRTDIDVEIVIDPNNPSGEHRKQKSAAPYVIFDRAYNWPIYLAYDGLPNSSLTPTSSKSNHITVYTISKALGMGGLRLGWAFINDEELANEIKRSIVLIGICPNSFSIQAAYLVFTQFFDSEELCYRYYELKTIIESRRDLVAQCKSFTVTNKTGPYAWIKSKDGSDIAKFLLDNYNIKVYSGTMFGSTAEYARLSLICDGDDFLDAIERLYQ